MPVTNTLTYLSKLALTKKFYNNQTPALVENISHAREKHFAFVLNIIE
jgi:hypothetical protein